MVNMLLMASLLIGPTPDPLPDLQALVPGDTFGRAVALTFDDGPHPVHTPKVLDELKRHGARATFFVTGKHAVEHPALIRRIVAEGHDLGNHSWDHPHLPALPKAEVERQLALTHWAVDKALGRHYDLRLVRAPYGDENDTVRRVAAEQGRMLVLWNAHARNVFTGDPPVLYARGGPILFHDPAPDDWKLMGGIVTRLQADGVAIVSLEELLARKHGLARSAKAAAALQAAARAGRMKARHGRAGK